MQVQEVGVAARLETLFKSLDAAAITPEAVLNSEARKECFESFFDDLVQSLIKLNFQPAPLTNAQT